VRQLTGLAVHAALETLISSLAEAGIPSALAPGAVEVLTRHGGLSVVLADALEAELGRASENPRAIQRMGRIRRQAEELMPETRAALQRMLSEVHGLAQRAKGGGGGSGKLGEGASEEVTLRSPGLKLIGVADLITLGPDHVEIRDFKSGRPKEQHLEQLKFYALLWSCDRRRNPEGRLVTALALSYPGGDRVVPVPTERDLTEFAEEIRGRVEAARSALGALPPPARPAVAACSRCDVRHLCEEYWVTKGSVDGEYVDLEVTIAASEAPGTVTTQARLPGQREANPARLRGATPRLFPEGLEARVLGARVSRMDAEVGDATPEFVLTSASEVFALP